MRLIIVLVLLGIVLVLLKELEGTEVDGWLFAGGRKNNSFSWVT